jgi:glutamate-ammonia-ligase adenylyltransferase
MALSRARTIAGDAALCAEVVAEVAALLALPRDARKVLAEASDMRAMIEEEKPSRDLWDIKLIPGGLIDLEFIAQAAVITGRVETKAGITGTLENLSRLKPEFADAQTRQELCDAYALYLSASQITRLCLAGGFDRADVPPGLSDLLLAATDLPDFGVLEAHLKETAKLIRNHFDRIIRAKRD